ncbi:MAG: hypothetical protein ACE5GD_00425 [Candidatus Geothermarchaeales archaeon]
MSNYTVTVKVDKELKRKMASVKINWSEYIRKAIIRRIELEERKMAAAEVLKSLAAREHTVPKGFINSAIREMREVR